MKFGLVLCTVGRDKEVEAFLESIKNQTYTNYELIVVDQNKDDKLEKIIEKYSALLPKVKYFKVDFKGLSRARNFGIKRISEDVNVVAFPDDDCIYPENLLLMVKEKFEKFDDLDFITGISIDPLTGIESNGRWSKEERDININNVWITATSFTIFVKKKSLLINFDEKLGVGAGTEFGSGEEMDFLIRLIDLGCRGRFFRDVVVYHPNKVPDTDRTFSYSMGMGAVFRKNFKLNVSFIANFLYLTTVRPIGGIFINLLRMDLYKVKLYSAVLIGRWKGFLNYEDKKQ